MTRWWPVLLLVCGQTALPGFPGAPASPTFTPTVELIGPAGSDLLEDITPTVTIRTTGVLATDRPLLLRLEVGVSPDFATGVLMDTSVIGDSATFTVPRPLPSRATVYFRARATTRLGETVFSATSPPRTVPSWLTLIAPAGPSGTTLMTRRPRFEWASATVKSPPGPWRYTLRVIRVATGQVTYSAEVDATSFTPPIDLDLNTSYRWSVTGRLGGADSITVASATSFLIANLDTPLATILYQPFPTPFPSATSQETCIWFDLATDARVQIDVLDLQGRLVRRLLPPVELVAGRHGRITAYGAAPCAATIRWDGKGDDGRFVPPGVYLLRMTAGRSVTTRQMLFEGR